MEKINETIVYRYPTSGVREWLRVIEKKTTEITEGKKHFGHGNLVDTAMGGNGYHGRCENCGLALVTDLGYNSWEGTKCEVKRSVNVTKDYRFVWQKDIKKATKLTEDQAKKHFSSLIYEQGWGRYCFGYKTESELIED